jgi:transposase
VKPIHFASDAAGFARFQHYLDCHSPDPRDFLILLEPTGSYGLTALLYLLGKGYRVLQVENRAVKDYREKIFGSETKTDDTDARLMARMGFLHELVGEEFSTVQPDQPQLGRRPAAYMGHGPGPHSGVQPPLAD